MATVNVGKFKDFKNELEDAKEQLGIGEPPPSGLVPVGDSGLYTTPNTPADPRDCDRYPSSPYCGENPFSKTPIGLDVSTTIQVEECGVTRSITVEPTLGFIKLPPVTAAYIPEECRKEYENQGKYKAPDPPETDLDNYEPTPQYRPYGYDLDTVVCCVTVDHYTQIQEEYNWVQKDWRVAITQIVGSADDIRYPSDELTQWYVKKNHPPGSLAPVICSVYGNSLESSFLNAAWMRDSWGIEEGRTTIQNIPQVFRMPEDYPTENERFKDGRNYKTIYYFPTTYGSLRTVALWIGKLRDIFPQPRISPIENSNSEHTFNIYGKTKTRIVHERFIVYCHSLSDPPIDRRSPPLPLPKKKCCEESMGCCHPSYSNQQQQDNARLLRLLMKIDKKLGEFPLQVTVFDENEDKRGAQHKKHNVQSVSGGIRLAIERNEKLAKIMGIDLLPITVPKSVIEKKGEGIFEKIFSFLDFNKNEEINSVLEMQTWMFQQLSGILGHWMMEIEVESDHDPTKEGDQDKEGKDKKKGEKENVILPNIAMTMREQITMQIQSLKALGLLVDMQIKSLIDLAGTKVLSAECAARLEDLQLYFDYETEEVHEDLALQVTMPNLNAKREEIENLANFLKTGTIQVSYDKWTVKKSQSLEEKLMQLLEMSSAIRALYFHSGG